MTWTSSVTAPSSAIIRATIPSTWLATPKTIPACSASTVFLAITERGRSNSTVRSCAPRRPSASSEISIPGVIAPPTYWPFPETTSNVVAVPPKSTTIAGPPYSSTAASALMMRSVPTSRGLSISTGMPVRTPGSTTRCATPANALPSISRHSWSTVGTVEQTAMPSTSSSAGPSSPRSSTAHSSEVRRASVATRQSALTSPLLTSPITVWLLPMSAARSATASALGEIEAEVEDLHGVGQSADGDEVDAGLGDLARPLERQPAGGLERRAAVGDADRLGHRHGVHVVEQDLGAADREQLAQLVEVGDLDLHAQVGVRRTHGLVGGHHSAGGHDVVVLDHR